MNSKTSAWALLFSVQNVEMKLKLIYTRIILIEYKTRVIHLFVVVFF